MSDKSAHRLFFALWPDHATQQKIFSSFKFSAGFQISENSAQVVFGQRLAKIHKPENLHMTLHFLGNLSPNDVKCVDELASKISSRAFTLRLNRYGCFAEARIFWLGVEKTPADLFYLHTELAEQIALCSLPVDARAYVPHITLVRNAPQLAEVASRETIVWKVDQFALVESLSGPHGVNYAPLKFYDLNAD